MVEIIKANGEKQEFSEEKLRASVRRAGIPRDIEEEVVAHIMDKLHEGMKTSEIYQHIIEFLDKEPTSHHRAKYSLKQSIMELGPTGYPFEKFVARLLEKEGYSTNTNVIAVGTCVSHEIDVVASKEKETYMVEAKFHNGSGIKTDVQVALYTHARFEDTGEKNNFTKSLLVTNTKLTTDAIVYSQCVGMHVISWGYPEGASLRELVEHYNLHPVTSLSGLSAMQKQNLLEQNIVLCSELVENEERVLLDLPQDKKQKIIAQARMICSESH